MDISQTVQFVIQAGDWPAWVQAIGSVLAILATLWVPWRERAKNQRHAREVAAMVLAIELKQWLDTCAEMVFATGNALGSHGQMGKLHSQILPFPFEARLDQVAALHADISRQTFSLIQEKNNTNSELSFRHEQWGVAEACAYFVGAAAENFESAFSLYQRLNNLLGWRSNVTKAVLDAIAERAAASRLNRAEEQEAGGIGFAPVEQ